MTSATTAASSGDQEGPVLEFLGGVGCHPETSHTSDLEAFSVIKKTVYICIDGLASP
jgi:hypothetical protein